MNYQFNDRNIRIPDNYLEKNMRILQITREEAIKQYLEDEGYLTNEEQETLVEKTKGMKLNTGAASGKPRKKVSRERKPDEEKEKIIEIVKIALENAGFQPKVTNKSKIIEFSIEENQYKLDLIKKRPPKQKKNE